MVKAALPAELVGLGLDPDRPLVVVDVDEVLAMFVRAFERFLGGHGLEMRFERYALYQNIFRPGARDHLDLAEGRRLFDLFFLTDMADIEAAPGGAEALAALARDCSIVIFTNAPSGSREARARWLAANGLDYPLVCGQGPKGHGVAELASRTRGPAAFVDDLLPNLESVAEEAPRVRRFQMVADERLRPLAFGDPARHRRIDAWAELGPAIAEALGIG